MPNFSQRSLDRLATCHPDLQRLAHEVIKREDITIICGHRGEAEQTLAFTSGKSKEPWPKSKHNQTPSLAVDMAPYPLNWADTAGFEAFGWRVLAIAQELGLPVRWGGDWNRNGRSDDERFLDLVHFELVMP